MSGAGKFGAPEHLIVNGKRLDGRGLMDMRPLTLEVGMVHHSNGSAVFKFGNTYALAAVQGPRETHPKWMADPLKAVLRCKYFMAPFATTERSRPGTNRRSTEISKVITAALANVVFLEDYPKAAIDIFAEILEANASTRCAGLNAAAMALADAGIPMRDLVSCVSIGKIEGQIALDIAGAEDNFGEVDCAIATVGGSDRVVLLQMDGIVTREEFSKLLKFGSEGCAKVYEKQKEALRKRYAIEAKENGQ